MSTIHDLLIPASVLTQAGLSPAERLVLAEIINLHKVKGLVWAGDDYFSARLAIPPRTIWGAINNLAKLGYIERVTKQSAAHKRILTPTSLCFAPLADSARATDEEAEHEQPLAEAARATPDLSQNPREPIAEVAKDLSHILPEPLADAASINIKEKERVNKPPSSRKGAGKGSTKSLSPEVKTPEEEQPSLGATLEAWEVWINENAPLVQKLKYPMTGKQYDGLIADYGETTVHSVLLGMQNRARLLKDYTSANLTCREWCGRRGPKLQKPAAKPAPTVEPEENEQEVKRAAEQQAAEASDFRRRILRENQSDAAA